MLRSTLEKALDQISGAFVDLRMELAARQLELALRKYRPDQPRVPAGVPTGGQWTDAGSTRMAMARFRLTPALEKECDEQFDKDTFECNMVGSRACHAQAAARYAACRTGKYVPDLNY